MKNLISIIILLISLNSIGQDISKIIGLSYSIKSDIIALDTLNKVDSRIDQSGTICSHFVDSSWSSHFIVLENRELINDSFYVYTIIDLIMINNAPAGSLILIGSNEFTSNKDKLVGFVISLECCYESTDNSWHHKSNEISKAWVNGKAGGGLIEINPNEIIRINEGYYYK